MPPENHVENIHTAWTCRSGRSARPCSPLQQTGHPACRWTTLSETRQFTGGPPIRTSPPQCSFSQIAKYARGLSFSNAWGLSAVKKKHGSVSLPNRADKSDQRTSSSRIRVAVTARTRYLWGGVGVSLLSNKKHTTRRHPRT